MRRRLCAIDVTVEAGARAVLVAQSATRLLGMEHGQPASQTVRLRVQAGGQLDSYPGLMIPFPDSSINQRVEIDLEPRRVSACSKAGRWAAR